MRVLDRLMRRLGYVPATAVQSHVSITIDGQEVARALREELRCAPIVVTTDYQRGIPCS